MAVRVPSILIRHPALAWSIPTLVVLALASVATGVFSSDPSEPALPDTSPRALVEAVTAAQNEPSIGYSGTIVADTSLGIAGVSAATLAGSATSGAGASAVHTGTYTMKYWYRGPSDQRVALVRVDGETDYFHDGTNVWQWDSAAQHAAHTRATANLAWSLPMTFPALTPQQLTARAIAAVEGGTTVSIGESRKVADRLTYELVLSPSLPAETRIGSIRICVDGHTMVPLSVQVYAKGQQKAAVDVSFTSVTFKAPDAKYFDFTPPPGASVDESEDDGDGVTYGSGWDTVTEYSAAGKEAVPIATSAPGAMTPVAGTWGQGELMDSPLLCALALSDGRVLVGAVDPPALFSAAADD